MAGRVSQAELSPKPRGRLHHRLSLRPARARRRPCACAASCACGPWLSLRPVHHSAWPARPPRCPQRPKA
eukprot:15440645-Alexandrium_andersonii.AAC.1